MKSPTFRSTPCSLLLLAGLAVGVCGAGPARAGLVVLDAPPVRLEAEIDGQPTPLPLLKTAMHARIQGDLASVRLTQVFANPHDVPLHARYGFPLPANAAVHAMRITSGDRVIEAEIRRKQEARAVFENAKQRGNQAALLEQHRPNVFTQEVTNLMPGLPVRVDLEYAHVVPKGTRGLEGDYAFQFPMVMGPRFVPPGSAESGAPTRRDTGERGAAGEPEPLAIGRWTLPASPPVARPEEIDRDRVILHVSLDGGLPIRRVGSPSHHIAVDRASDRLHEITLADGPAIDNRDFVLEYRLAGDELAAGTTAFAEDGEGFVSLLVEPPAPADAGRLSDRELVFVLDCSGSMSGVPMEASKRFMRRALPQLRPDDWFRIIRFSETANDWSERPLPATPDNIQRALAHVDGLYGTGGTRMTEGIRTALAPPVPGDALRLVVFLTDGYIGNDLEVVRLVEAMRGDARLFSFGVGNGVNRWLLEEMARVGRGAARIVLPDQDPEKAADELAARLESPALTHVRIDWGDAPVTDVYPEEAPDLFLGQSLRLVGRSRGSGDYRVTVHGRVAGRPVRLPVDLSLPSDTRGSAGDALPILWARAAVEDRMIDYRRPGLEAAERDAIQEQVVRLGLEHRLVTQWTSFVAVAKEIVNPGGPGRDADVAVPPVAGLSPLAYPPGALRGAQPKLVPAGNGKATLLASADAFAGNAAPEPGTWLALACLASVGFASSRRRRWNRRDA